MNPNNKKIFPGMKFGRLTVLDYPPNTRKVSCRCECSAITSVWSGNLLRGFTKSCGCLHAEVVGAARITHGDSRNKSSGYAAEYRIWCHIIARCYNQNDAAYSRYGGRGIGVYADWRESYAQFLADVGRRPSPKYSLDRVDNDGNYEPRNVRWATSKEQSRNTRRNRRIEFDGKNLCLSEWAEVTGISIGTLWSRLARGWSAERALSTLCNGGECVTAA